MNTRYKLSSIAAISVVTPTTEYTLDVVVASPACLNIFNVMLYSWKKILLGSDSVNVENN